VEDEARERYWSRFPDTYDGNQEYVVGKELLDDIKQELNLLPELGDMVEFGCGSGYFTASIVQKANHLVATDLSNELLEKARERFHENPKVVVQKENCMETSFISEGFDTVFMANVIHVVEDPFKTLHECHRILKHGGVLIIVTYTGYGMQLWEKFKLGVRFLKTWGKPPVHTHVFSPERLAGLVENAGFSIKEVKLIGNQSKAVFVIGKKA